MEPMCHALKCQPSKARGAYLGVSGVSTAQSHFGITFQGFRAQGANARVCSIVTLDNLYRFCATVLPTVLRVWVNL